MKRRVLSWILAGALLFQSVSVEAAQSVAYDGADQGIVGQASEWKAEQTDGGEYDGAVNGAVGEAVSNGGGEAVGDTVNKTAGSTDGVEVVSSGEGLQVEVTQDEGGLFQEGSFKIPEREDSGIVLFSAEVDEQEETEKWEKWDAYICEQLKSRANSINVADFRIPSNQLSAWYYGVINEHPELYFVNSTISWSLMGDVVNRLIPVYEEGSHDDAAFTRASQEALSVVTEEMSDVQKAVALHDYLVVNCEYDYQNYLDGTIPTDSYSAYGALVNGTAVCQGYALAYKYLLQEVGIPCYMVSSEAMNHAWNMVELGGELYHVDVTWDDPTWDSLGRVRHDNMFVSDGEFFNRTEEEGRHYYWTISYRGEAAELQAQDTTYDEFFWKDVTSPLILRGGSYYYTAYDSGKCSINSISVSATGSLSCGEAKPVYDQIETWHVWGNANSRWQGVYSGLFMLGGRLYFNTPTQICSIKPDGTDIRTEFDADTTTGYIYGCAYRRGEVCYVLHQNAGEKGKENVLTATLSGKIDVEAVSLSRTELSLFIENTAQLTAGVTPQIATNKTITWSSSDEKVATVSDDGLVTAIGIGTCIITAAAGGCKAECSVNVVKAYEVTFELQGHGQRIAPVTAEAGKKLSEPETPTEEGYLFKGWYQEASCTTQWNFDTDVITADTMLYAKWIETNLDDSEYTFTTLDDQTVSSKADGKPKVLFFFKTNCWNCQQTNRSISEHMDEFTGVDFYALEIAGKTKDEVAGFKDEYGCDGITYSYDKEGTNNSAMWKYCSNFGISSSVTTPVIVFIDAGNRLQHLTTGVRSWSEVLADIQKYCNYSPQESEKTYKITYELDGGMNYSGNPDTYTAETDTILLKDAVKEGYTFEGWYRDPEFKEEVKEIVKGSTGDITLYAKWNIRGITVNDIAEDKDYTERIDFNSVNGAVANIKSKVYGGSPYTPAVKVTIQPEAGKSKKLTLTEGIDYRVRYENCTNAGTATVVVEGNGNYTGTIRQEYTITQKPINKCKVVTGGVAVDEDPSKLELCIYDGNKLLVKGVDYDFTADKSVTVKKTNSAKAVVTGKGNYKGTVNAKFTVYERSETGVITPESVKLTITSTPYTGKAIKCDDSLTVTVNDEPLVKNKQYSVTYKNNTNAGTAFVTITGKGGYTGKVVKSFTITPLGGQKLEIKDITAKTYNGKLQTPAVIVKLGKKKLSKNKDYTLTYTNNLHTGKATVNITGKGNYAGTKGKITFDIKTQKISKASVKGNREEGLTLTYNKKTLREGVDYTLSYDETSVKNNKIKVTIKGLGDFAGSEVIKTVKNAAKDPAAKITPKSSTNKGKQNYVWNRWASTVKSYLTENQDGTLLRVEYAGSKVWAETYQADGSCIDQKEIKPELPLFGGFYAGKDNYFLVFGQENPNENDNAEVIRVVKYDKNWKRQGAVGLYGANTTVPFEAGSLRMTEYGGMLYVRTSHKMYKSSDGLNHQANLTFSVKVDEMRITDQYSTIMNKNYGYVSHSFNQFINVDGNKLVAVDHGDGAPRAVVLVQYLAEAGGESFTEQQFWKNDNGSFGMGNCINVDVLPIQGGYGANDTGVSVGGFEVSGSSYLVAGNSVAQDDAASYNALGKRNIFVTCTPKESLVKTNMQTAGDSTTVRWITSYTEKDSVNVSTPQLVKLGDNKFMLLWAEGDTVKAVILDGTGNPTTGIHSMKGALSDCQPILTGDSVTWYYTNNSAPVFCRLRIEDVK
ncbi:MAG: InlB B-repeat-containing protein [Butyrivibrio sp.]|nr:InlB B-repeat-containing protein [Muribaculum sp.]MCM1551539.1 InlB B-repeat-containing protein [Butyrivibrio sp.]